MNRNAYSRKIRSKIGNGKGDIDHQGRTKIAIIVDGAWSKRSYKVKHSVLSGVVSKMRNVFNKIK